MTKMENIVDNLDDKMMLNLNKIRLVGDDFVADPAEVKECVMKPGAMTDLVVCNKKGISSFCSCIVAEDKDSMPFELGNRIKDAICGDVYTGFKLEPVGNSSEQNTYKRGDMVVIKVMSLHKINLMKRKEYCAEDAFREISILQMFEEGKHKNVCEQIECIRDERYIYSIMRHYGEELFNYAGKLSEDNCRNYFRQIINGVESMQKLNICHRDLSLENILVSRDGVCTIIDFGMSLIFPTAKESTLRTVYNKLVNHQGACIEDDVGDEDKVILMPPQGTCGKLNYIAPEILRNDEPFNGAMVDNWSLGVILFMLLTGRPPFHRASMLDKWYRMIQKNKLTDMLSIWKVNGLSDNSIDLLQSLLKGSNHKMRMNTSEILLHPWFKTALTATADKDTLCG